MSELPPNASSTAARERVKTLLLEHRSNHGWKGAWVLFCRENLRFVKIAGQTLLSPALTTLLYFVVFGYSLGSRLREMGGIPYIDFLAPGLVMMAVINNAFAHSAFSFFITKVHGSVVDLLVSPLSPLQIAVAYTASCVVRGMVVGAIIWMVAAMLGASTIFAFGFTLLFLAVTAAAFGLLGLITAILAKDFEHVNLIPAFVVMPLTFLGGVFYSVELLPAAWRSVSLFNPILYMVNGLRYGMTGTSDVPVAQGLALAALTLLLCGAVVLWLLASGRKLRE
jgi:ABC-2 type transport system permease protein